MNKCEIISDLLILYVDDLTGEESNKFIEDHIKGCRECREKLETLKSSLSNNIKDEKVEISPLNDKKLVNRIKKKIAMIIAISLVIGSISGILIYNKVIFQEGNPVPIVAGISKLSFTNRDIVKIADNPKWYIISAKDGYDPIINIMEGEGWEYIEQIGSGLIFQKGDERLTISTVQFTRWYRIIKLPSRERTTVND